MALKKLPIEDKYSSLQRNSLELPSISIRKGKGLLLNLKINKNYFNFISTFSSYAGFIIQIFQQETSPEFSTNPVPNWIQVASLHFGLKLSSLWLRFNLRLLRYLTIFIEKPLKRTSTHLKVPRQKEGERRLGRDQLHLGSRVIYREGEPTATLTSGPRCFDKFLYKKLVKCKFLVYDCGVLTNLKWFYF